MRPIPSIPVALCWSRYMRAFYTLASFKTDEVKESAQIDKSLI